MRSPGAGFDQPFEMLDACHDRVRRSLDLLRRLRDYLRGHGHGCDDSARQAARDVLRYFDIAAPLHHEDEELHVFPPLLAQEHDAPLVTLVRQLQRDHVRMAERWATARGPLQAMADGQLPAFSAEHEAALDGFAECYTHPLRQADDSNHPPPRPLRQRVPQSAMGQEMARRRGVR